MKDFKAEYIRNVTILGHIGSGKTSFVESCLYTTSTTSKKGSIETKDTVSDFTKEEKKRQMSLYTSIIPVEHRGCKINLLDTPGHMDLIAEVTSALKVSSAAILIIDAENGVEVGTEFAWDYLRNLSIPTFIFINKLDLPNVDYDKLITQIRELFGKRCIPLCIPNNTGDGFESFTNIINYRRHEYKNGKYEMIQLDEASVREEVVDYRAQLEEACAEVSDELMEKYFADGELSIDDIYHALTIGQGNGEIVPILVGSSLKNIGVDYILNKIVDNTYPPVQEREKFSDALYELDKYIDPFGDFSAFCFKTTIDPFLGQMNYLQVKSGHLHKDQIICIEDDIKEKYKLSNVFFLRGNKTEEVERVYAGDIVVVAKVDKIKTNQTVKEPGNEITIEKMIEHPSTYFKAVKAKNEKEDDKMAQGLSKICLTDRSLTLKRQEETNQLLLGGLGVTHLELVLEKLANTYQVQTELFDQDIVYRETILGNSDVQGKYKKQTGGSGQYGDVFIRFEPTDEDFIFEEKIFGGSVPKNYIPAVQKGLEEAIKKGCLAGYPVIGLKATLYDGSYHEVDSSEFAFKMAAHLAYKKGFMEARPVLLEPVMNVSVTVPIDYTGDIIGDFSRRRGIVLGMEPLGNKQVIKAKVPQSELLSYTVDLKQMTQARGSFTMKFDSYQQTPSDVQDKVIKARASILHPE